MSNILTVTDKASNQLEKINKWNQDFATVYRLLGGISVDLSEKKGEADKLKLKEIRGLLE